MIQQAGRKHLRQQLKLQDNSNNTSMIINSNGVVTFSKDVNKAFEMFYKDLYTSTCILNTEEVETFFKGLNLPTISEE